MMMRPVPAAIAALIAFVINIRCASVECYVRKIAEPDVTIGVTLSGALTPTGLGTSAIVRVDQDQLHIPFVQGRHLLPATKPKHVLLV